MQTEKDQTETSRKRYWFSITEEMVLNPDYRGYRGGRVECYDREANSPYAQYEARFLIPEEFYEDFLNTFDCKESDLMPYLYWDYQEEETLKPI